MDGEQKYNDRAYSASSIPLARQRQAPGTETRESSEDTTTAQQGVLYDAEDRSILADEETVEQYNEAMSGNAASESFKKMSRTGYGMGAATFMLQPPSFQYILPSSVATPSVSWKSNMNGKLRTFNEESLGIYSQLVNSSLPSKIDERPPEKPSKIHPFHQSNSRTDNYGLYLKQEAMRKSVQQPRPSLKDIALTTYEESMDITNSHSS